MNDVDTIEPNTMRRILRMGRSSVFLFSSALPLCLGLTGMMYLVGRKAALNPMPAKRASTLRGRIKRQTRLGEMLRLYRTVRGYSLREAANTIDIGHATLMRIETGQEFDAGTLLKLWIWMRQEEQV